MQSLKDFIVQRKDKYMKIIKITTDNKIIVCEKEGNYARKELEQLLDCEYVENVMPKRLYKELQVPKIEALMLVDEDGHLHQRKMNLVGSWLYETDIHGVPIVGDILIVGFSRKTGNICGLEEGMFNELYSKFEKIIIDFDRSRLC